MAAQCHVLINCVGPYSVHGEPVVRACLDNGTSQVDLSGEHEYIESLMLRYDRKAAQQDCYIINACGAGFLSEEVCLLFAKKHFPGKLVAVELFTAYHTGGEKLGVNLGTFHSMLETMSNQSQLKQLRQQVPAVTPTQPAYRLPGRMITRRPDGYFYLPGDSTPISRTQTEEFRVNGTTPIDYHTYMKVGSPMTMLKAILALFVIILMNLTKYGRSILLKYPRFFTFGVVHPEGPPEELIRQQSYESTIECHGYSTMDGSGKPDKKVVMVVSGPDPAYIATSSLLVESAYTILREKEKLPDSGGVMTPGFALKDSSILERLAERNIKFEVLSG